MRTDRAGCSTCPPGQEQHEWFETIADPSRHIVQFDYRHPDGTLFSTCASTLTEAREQKDRWLAEHDRKVLEEISTDLDLVEEANAERLGLPYPPEAGADEEREL